MFYKDYLLATRRDDLCAFTKFIVIEIKLEKNHCFLHSIVDQMKFQMNLTTIVKMLI